METAPLGFVHMNCASEFRYFRNRFFLHEMISQIQNGREHSSVFKFASVYFQSFCMHYNQYFNFDYNSHPIRKYKPFSLSPTGCGIVWFETWNQRRVKWLSFSLALYKTILGSSRAYKSPGGTTTNSQTGKSGYRRRVEIKLLVSKCKRSNVGIQTGNC